MLRLFALFALGGGAFLISALWIGHTDGILLGLLGFSMIVIALLGYFLWSWVYTTFFVIQKAGEAVAHVARAAAKTAKEQKVFDQLGQAVNDGGRVIRLVPSNSEKEK